MDYSYSAVKLIFSGSMMRQCVNITIIDDNLCELSESFFVQLAAFDPNIVLDPNQATSNIADNDCTLTSKWVHGVKILSVYRVALPMGAGVYVPPGNVCV